ncbi:MAG TPA: DUF2147 domain-containing protein [Flavobacteriales bacterium]|nr:DUF2147 domain-containing protein [Flavobacteriales bacterium]HQV74058.1 DUF2147 domain-containing protein [Flavobacteriales bacterium]HQW39569.1 DUF2147 domain-containing protein [Flavobacteriales bacterium]
MERLFLLLLVCYSSSAFAQDIAGRWTTINDHTGIKTSLIEIKVINGIATGHVLEIMDKAKQKNRCNKCTDDRKDQPIMGMEIIRNMRKKGAEWSGGTIMDPATGDVYDCKLWVEDGKLKVRGYVAFFYRTQVWVR